MDLKRFNQDHGQLICAIILTASILFIGASTRDMQCEGSSCYVGGSMGGTLIELREHFNISEWITFILSGLAIIDLLYLNLTKKKGEGENGV